MKVLGWLKAVLSVVIGLAIGLAATGVVNLLAPTLTTGWILGAALAASALSALAGFLVAGGRKKVAAPAKSAAPPKDAAPGAK
jgi:hypothetical protein